MFKTLGLILIFISSAAFGIYLAVQKRKKLLIMKKLYSMLCDMKVYLQFNQLNKNELLNRLCDLGYGMCIDALNVPDYFPNGTSKEVYNYISRLGTRDLKSELEALDRCADTVKQSVDEFEKSTSDSCKLCVGAGVLIGTFLVVMLI